DITEKYLVGYRAYDYAPGAENPFTGDANNNNTPFLKFAISSHFDVKREYNPGTGEQTNVISENTTDRTWEKRQYMRVDWGVDLNEMTSPTIQSPAQNAISETDYGNPRYGDRPIISNGYIDFV